MGKGRSMRPFPINERGQQFRLIQSGGTTWAGTALTGFHPFPSETVRWTVSDGTAWPCCLRSIDAKLYPALSAQQTHVVSPLVPSESQSEATCGWLLSHRESQGDGVTRRRLLLPSPLKRCHLPQRGRPGVRADLFREGQRQSGNNLRYRLTQLRW